MFRLFFLIAQWEIQNECMKNFSLFLFESLELRGWEQGKEMIYIRIVSVRTKICSMGAASFQSL